MKRIFSENAVSKMATSNTLVVIMLVALIGGGIYVVGTLREHDERLNAQKIDISNTNGHLDEMMAFVDSTLSDQAATVQVLSGKVDALAKDDDDDDDDK